MTQKLIIIRGLPGSGKSTLAREMISLKNADSHFETDQYFMSNGVYKFDANKLRYAHEWCFDAVRHHLLTYGETVVVSNTFTQKWEADRYLELAKEHGIKVEIITCNAEYESIHNIPEETMTKMRERFVVDTSDWN